MYIIYYIYRVMHNIHIPEHKLQGACSARLAMKTNITLNISRHILFSKITISRIFLFIMYKLDTQHANMVFLMFIYRHIGSNFINNL